MFDKIGGSHGGIMLTRKSVLMVDDNIDLLEMVKMLFDPKEFLLVTAKDGSEGLLKAQNQKFDVVVSDIKMPKMDGIRFIQEFRRLIKHETPVLIYSAHLDELPLPLKNIKSLYRLSKPSQGYELVQRVRSLAEAANNKETTTKVAPVALNPFYKSFESGAYIFREGETGAEGMIIQKGQIGIYKEFSDGKEVLIDTLEEGEFLGEIAPQESQFRYFTAKALTTVELTIYPQAILLKEIEGKPEWFQKMVQGQHKRLINAYQRMRTFIKAA
jgi:CheY-like chemotaxis protein